LHPEWELLFGEARQYYLRGKRKALSVKSVTSARAVIAWGLVAINRVTLIDLGILSVTA